MFGFFRKKDETKKLLRGSDPQAENIFIHTMDKDLKNEAPPKKESLNEGVAPKENKVIQESPRPVSRINIDNLTDQQKSSPFLNKASLPEPSMPFASKPPVELSQKTAINTPSVAPFAPKPIPPSVPRPVPPIAPQKLPAQSVAKPQLPANVPKPVSVTLPPKNIFSGAKDWKSDLKEAEQPDKKNFKKLVIILSVILTATIVLAGTYYFLSSRKNTDDLIPAAEEAPVEEQAGSAASEETSPTEEPALSKFSTVGLNYLEVDVNDQSPEAMKEALKSYVQEVQASGITSALEFKVVTPEKSPLSLPTFLEKMKITFSPELASSLEDGFSVYIYNDRGSPGVGLAVHIKKDIEPEDIMLREEKNLPDELKALFPAEQYTLEKNKSFSTAEFDSSIWGKLGIRYLNIISPENLSVDYVFIESAVTKLLVGTTKMTLRSMIEIQKMDISTP